MTDEARYEDRLVLFIDILGFKSIVLKSVADDELLEFVYKCIGQVSGDSIEEETYKNVPWIPINDKSEKVNIITPNHPEFDEKAREKWPISVTHFSDCIVMSSKATIQGACNLLMRAANELMYSFFEKGILLRGGITVGKLIHERSGVVFGPALIEAYELESKEAKYPRFVVSKTYQIEFKDMFDDAYLELFSLSSDGYFATDITQVARLKILGQGEFSFEPIDSRIKKLMDSVKNEPPEVKEKVQYLHREWEVRKLEILEEIGN